jgi:hypothetical protein
MNPICKYCKHYDPKISFCYYKGCITLEKNWCCGFLRRKEEEEMPNNVITIKDMSIEDLMKLKNNIISEIENRKKESYENAVKAVVKSIDELINNTDDGDEDTAIEIGTIDGCSDESYSWVDLKYMIKTTHNNIDF